MTSQPIRAERADPALRQLHLLYHELRTGAAAYSYVTSTDLFKLHMQLCSNLLTSQSHLSPIITFDDGHISNYTLAAPILASFGLTAHFFITAGWTATRSGFMDWSQLRSLVAAGHRIGAHGWSHQLLTHCTSAELEMELRRPRQMLEDKLGIAINTMSLPGGRANRRVFAACRDSGYAHVYTSVPRAEPVPARRPIGRVNIRGDMQPSGLDQLLTPSNPSLARLTRNYRLKVAAQSLLGDRLYAHLWSIANREEPASDLPADSSVPRGPSS